MVMHIAELYHIPPWQVAEDCTAEWWGYMMEWQKAKNKAKKDGQGS
jgi:hypothetical protein